MVESKYTHPINQMHDAATSGERCKIFNATILILMKNWFVWSFVVIVSCFILILNLILTSIDVLPKLTSVGMCYKADKCTVVQKGSLQQFPSYKLTTKDQSNRFEFYYNPSSPYIQYFSLHSYCPCLILVLSKYDCIDILAHLLHLLMLHVVRCEIFNCSINT